MKMVNTTYKFVFIDKNCRCVKGVCIHIDMHRITGGDWIFRDKDENVLRS